MDADCHHHVALPEEVAELFVVDVAPAVVVRESAHERDVVDEREGPELPLGVVRHPLVQVARQMGTRRGTSAITHSEHLIVALPSIVKNLNSFVYRISIQLPQDI